MAAPLVYIAGPAVFLPDPEVVLAAASAALRRHGLAPMPPVTGADAEEHLGAEGIYRDNCRRIDGCAGMLADCTPFRGPSLDPGTAWEIGYAVARGLPVAGWSDDPRPYCERARPDGRTIENFGLFENLMIARSVRLAANIEGAAALLAGLLRR